MISLKTHNILDYVGGILLLFVPAIFGFSGIDPARNLFLFSGIALITYSLLTRYQYSLWKIIPPNVHMSLDVLNGVLLMLGPWIFGYRSLLSTGQEVIHYILALGVYALVAFTRVQAEEETLTTTETTSISSRSYTDTEAGSRERRTG